MEKLAAFDLEIAKLIPDSARDWDDYFPLGITCAAVAVEYQIDPIIWQGVPRMNQKGCQEIVVNLMDLVNQGYKLVTWNGCGFDFKVLGHESGLGSECAQLAAEHVDLMLMVTFKQGHYLGLDKALRGAGLQGKLKQVELSTGEVITDMDGARAPELWKRGEYPAVLAYLRDDVLQPLGLAREIEKVRQIRWVSGRGGLRWVDFDRLYTVRECFQFPAPDTSWMQNPPKRDDFIRWMPGGVLPEETF